MKRKRKHCAYCGGGLTARPEGDILRDYCVNCDAYFYDNPLPVVSSIVIRDRKILLVRRKFDPGAGLWCLPMGFAESGESIENAALRELEEEAGIKGTITGLVDIESGISATYGDLLFVTFEVEWIEGEYKAGDDASEVSLFSFQELPEMAFSSNIHAIKKFLLEKEEYWAILDSFSKIVTQDLDSHPELSFLSAKLVKFIDDNLEVISRKWLEDVRTNRSTPSYARFDTGSSLERSRTFILHYERWLEGKFSNQDIRNYYQQLGAARKAEGFSLSELLSAISLTRKHIWEFSLAHGVWNRTIDIYMALELERNMMLFFDKVSYHMTVGFEMDEQSAGPSEK